MICVSRLFCEYYILLQKAANKCINNLTNVQKPEEEEEGVYTKKII